MKTTRRTLHSSLLLKVLFFMLVISFFWADDLSAQTQNPLKDKLQEMVNKTKAIRLKFVSIVSKGQGIQGWDKFADVVEQAGMTITNVENKIDSLTNRLGGLKLPFPDKLRIPGYSITILGNQWNFPDLEARFPTFNRNFPHVSQFFSQFLEPGDGLLDKTLQIVTEIDDSMTIVTDFPSLNYLSPESSDFFPVANYLDGEGVRNSILAKARFNRWIVIISSICDGYREAVSNILGQVIVYAAGGNLKSAAAIVDVLITCLNVFKELIGDIGSDITASEVTASYDRLEYIHFQVDTLKNEFNDWKSLSIRTRIEINLSGHGDHPHPIAIFQLPVQYGGYLELARDIVVETINNMIAAGQNVFNAQNFLDKGNVKFAAGNYKKAYYYYSKAYGEATMVSN